MYSFSDSFPGYDPANYAWPVTNDTSWMDDMRGEAERDYYDSMAPATTLSEAHSHWHAVNGWDTVCDLDCGAGEYYDEPEPDDFDEDAAEQWQMYGEPEAREEMSAQEYNIFEYGIDPPF